MRLRFPNEYKKTKRWLVTLHKYYEGYQADQKRKLRKYIQNMAELLKDISVINRYQLNEAILYAQENWTSFPGF